MRARQFITEGAELMGYQRDEKMKAWTFPKNYAKDHRVEGPRMSNATARQMLDTLGLDSDYENSPPIKIDLFINMATQWLKSHLGRPSQSEPGSVSGEPNSATMIFPGREEGHMNKLIMSLNQQARAIKQHYPELTHVAIV